MMPVLAAIDWAALFEVVWVSLLAGTGVTAIFSLVIYGSARATEAVYGPAFRRSAGISPRAADSSTRQLAWWTATLEQRLGLRATC